MEALYGLSKKSLTHFGHVRIVDFGAGAAAGRIGTALMVAQAIEDGIQFDSVCIDEIEPSIPMQKMGELIWKAFVQKYRLDRRHIIVRVSRDYPVYTK